LRLAHQQVFAIVVKQIYVVARHTFGQPRTHFGGKNRVPQLLRFANLVLVLCPRNLNSALSAPRQKIKRGVGWPWMK
jgi:hypothetical protein